MVAVREELAAALLLLVLLILVQEEAAVETLVRVETVVQAVVV